jgi:ABC-type sugar transport system permease subunit
MSSNIQTFDKTKRDGLSPRFSRQGWSPYIFVSPFFILFALFFLLPSIAALVLSVFQWNGIGDLQYTGLSNYERIYSDRVFWQALRNTGAYTVANVFIVIPLALVMAVLLNAKSLRFAAVWRAMYFAPIVTSTVATALVFSILMNKESGLLNVPVTALGFEPINWFGDRFWVKISIIIMLIWRNTGLVMIYFIAGLQGMPQELYEAAEIDGANKMEQFLKITIPLLRPIILYVSIIVMLSSMQIFDEINILTGGGPANASVSVVQYLYSRGFERLRLGYASAVGTILFAIVFIFSLIQLRFIGAFGESGEAT